MRVLLVSTYELGHQPLHVASPAARLRAAGHDVRALDLSVEPWDPALVDWAEAVGISVPMHTAMRLGIRVATAVRKRRAMLPICFYGLYAPVGSDHTVGRLADRAIAGEYEPRLLEWVASLAGGGATGDQGQDPAVVVELGRGRAEFAVPARDLLPPIERYAHLAVDGAERPVGYVETTHGCAHRCRHCPIPVVYDGAFRVVGAETVIADIAQLVEAGARHITFGDPDFLNGPGHVLPIVEELHARWPDVTFDCTVKVEHILDQETVWEELARCGCLFVVTAVESMDDDVLTLLDKGHTADQAVKAVEILRAAGIEPRPTFLPFTPWTTAQQLEALVDFVLANDLIGNVDPVQLTIRLLIPEGSLLLARPELRPHLGGYDAELLGYRWTAGDPAMDALQPELERIAAAGADGGHPPAETLLEVARRIRADAGSTGVLADAVPAGSTEGRPRLTEPWFC